MAQNNVMTCNTTQSLDNVYDRRLQFCNDEAHFFSSGVVNRGDNYCQEKKQKFNEWTGIFNNS